MSPRDRPNDTHDRRFRPLTTALDRARGPLRDRPRVVLERVDERDAVALAQAVRVRVAHGDEKKLRGFSRLFVVVVVRGDDALDERDGRAREPRVAEPPLRNAYGNAVWVSKKRETRLVRVGVGGRARVLNGGFFFVFFSRRFSSRRAHEREEPGRGGEHVRASVFEDGGRDAVRRTVVSHPRRVEMPRAHEHVGATRRRTRNAFVVARDRLASARPERIPRSRRAHHGRLAMRGAEPPRVQGLDHGSRSRLPQMLFGEHARGADIRRRHRRVSGFVQEHDLAHVGREQKSRGLDAHGAEAADGDARAPDERAAGLAQSVVQRGEVAAARIGQHVQEPRLARVRRHGARAERATKSARALLFFSKKF